MPLIIYPNEVLGREVLLKDWNSDSNDQGVRRLGADVKTATLPTSWTNLTKSSASGTIAHSGA